MESLTFTLLAILLLKYQDELKKSGFHMELDHHDNIYQDRLVIFKPDNFRTSYFVMEHLPWNRARSFTIYQSTSAKYQYLIDPRPPYDPVPLNSSWGGSTSDTTTTTTNIFQSQKEPSVELQQFGSDVIDILKGLYEKILEDKLLMSQHGY